MNVTLNPVTLVIDPDAGRPGDVAGSTELEPSSK
jgi:hypothetical protein